ncbi:MAG: D-2-hydroxyacid dehydrogenase [Pyrinomonadaceae bacterium]
MERIVFLDRSSIEAVIREPSFEHEWIDFPMTQPGEVVERLKDATIAVTNKVPLRKESIDQLPKLKKIAVAATGTDCVDVNYCQEKGIAVSNVTGYSAYSVPEHVFTMILVLRRNLIRYLSDVKKGKWQRSETFCILDHPINELNDSTFGIIGYGALGKAVEKIALAFGMNVIISEHKNAAIVRNGRTAFDEVIKNSDVITLHCPLTDDTRGLFGERELAKMKPNSLLINTARGGIVEESALVNALRSGNLAGAGFDVLTAEPPKEGNPLLGYDGPNLILTPHVAWASREAMQTLADILIDNIEVFVNER